jgi:hypothetical protein
VRGGRGGDALGRLMPAGIDGNHYEGSAPWRLQLVAGVDEGGGSALQDKSVCNWYDLKYRYEFLDIHTVFKRQKSISFLNLAGIFATCLSCSILSSNFDLRIQSPVS